MSNLRQIILILLSIILVTSCTSKKNTKTVAQVNVFIWSNYISDQMVKKFEQTYNAKVILSHFASNEELLSKLQAGAIGYDVIVPSDYMVKIMTKLNLLQELDKNKLPNATLLDQSFLNQSYDPTNKYSLPYGWATSGIAINKKFYKGPSIKSWKDLFENSQLKGKINLLDDNREVFAASLKHLGYSLNSTVDAEVKNALQYLKQVKSQIKSFNSDPMDMILSGEVWATQMYSPDALQAQSKSNSDVEYIIPEEGCTLSIDNLAVPVGAKNVELAHAFINFLISEENNLDFVSKIYAGPVVKTTKAKLPIQLKNNASLFPSKIILNKLEKLEDLGDKTSILDQMWTEFKTF